MTDSERLDWLEGQSTLHYQVDILYVVDGYQIQFLRDGDIDAKRGCYFGASLREALNAAMKGKV